MMDDQELPVDDHPFHPAGCLSCAELPMDRACLAHTCPDCGAIVWGTLGPETGELVHRC